ncbi:hypothetical protein F503_04701 [Ophiostoma piceae UAMH 11346]|uniref:Uncharacterized protein n=1 Tax=Ophiostoma piceae (strain UAMH 11346) TaxID=1262450 RepID=S3BXL0_OPHP1|nr:hypothetical protein F503_04701 [Ophiostoma piceae UAMH 11346]
MAELHLVVDSVDNAEEIQREWEELEKQRKLNGEKKAQTSWRDWLGFNKKPKLRYPPEIRKGGTDYSDARAAAILKDYLQPTTTLSEKDAFDSIMVLIPQNGQSNSEVAHISNMFIELAEQIHFDHPSHFKLAWLVGRIGSSPKFTYDLVNGFNVCQLLGEYIYDQQTGNDENYLNVNIVAFHAKICACGLWCHYESATIMLRFLFEDKRNNDFDDVFRSGRVMEGAVWILFYGYIVYQMILQDKDADRWVVWRAGFASMETESFATDECKKLSARAVRMMDALTYVP